MVVHWETLFLGFRISIPIKYGTNAQLMQASARLLRQICSQFDTKSSLVSVSPSYNAMINYVQPLSPFPFSSVSGLVKSISSPPFSLTFPLCSASSPKLKHPDFFFFLFTLLCDPISFFPLLFSLFTPFCSLFILLYHLCHAQR